MRTLVTGHLGYIGVELTPVLQRLGHDLAEAKKIKRKRWNP